MDIFPSLLGEAEFELFTEQDYLALSGVLNDTLAKYIKEYLENPAAKPEVVAAIQKNIGPLINSLTFHYVLFDKGIIDLISKLSPENLVNSSADFEDIKEKLKFLEDNIGNLRVTISARPKSAYQSFITSVKGVLDRQKLSGITPTYPDILARIEGNKFAFYVPNDKGHPTGTQVVNSRRRVWMMCLRGLEYKEYCDNHNVNYIKRRLF